MLGLGSSVNNEEGYAKGERYRERFHTGGTWHATTNPIGRDGSESNYFGDFETGTDADVFKANLANAGSASINSVGGGNEYKFRASSNLGYSWITISVVPYTSYKLTLTFDKSSTSNGAGRVYIGTSAGDNSIADSGELAQGNTDASITFNSSGNNSLFLSLHCVLASKTVYWDDISLKEA